MSGIKSLTDNRVVFDNGIHFDVQTGWLSNDDELFSENTLFDNMDKLADNYSEPVVQLQLSMTDACNMSCSYCSFRDRVGFNGKSVNMPLKIANDAVAFFKKGMAKDVSYARIDFGVAGEPMLRRHLHDELFKSIEGEFEDSNATAIWAGANITNGTLAIEKNFIGTMGPPQDISCDGPKEVHDDMRIYNDGKGTYDDVVAVAKEVLQRHPNIGVSAVLTARHTNFDEIFSHLYNDLGFKNIYMKPVNTSHDVDYGLNIDTISSFKEGYTKLVDFILNQPKDEVLSCLLSLCPEDFFMRYVYRVKDRSKQVHRCGAGKSGSYVDTDGKLYACAHFIGKPGWDIGNIYEGFNEEVRQKFDHMHVDTREPCRSCWARYHCGGGCYYQAVLANGDINKPDGIKCMLIKHLLTEAIRLVTTLSNNMPDVLLAMPSPYFINEQSLSSSPTTNYKPLSYLKIQSDSISIELVQKHKIEGALLDGSNSVQAKFVQDKNQLSVQFDWKTEVAVRDISFWFFSPAEEPVKMEDLRVISPELHGKLFRLNEDGVLFEIDKKMLKGPVKKVPYEERVWREVNYIKAERSINAAKLEMPLNMIIPKGGKSCYGFNVMVEFENGARCSLVRYEPFAIVNAGEVGNLVPCDGEFLLDENNVDATININIPGMQPLGKWTGQYANVC